MTYTAQKWSHCGDFLQFSFEASRDDLEALSTRRPQFKYKLRAARNKHGLRRQKLADELNISRETMDRWEAGEREPSMRMYAALYQIFGEEILPKNEKMCFREEIKLARYRYGMSQEEAAESLNRSTHWMMQAEKSKRPLPREDQKLLECFVEQSFHFQIRSSKSLITYSSDDVHDTPSEKPSNPCSFY